MEEYVMPENNKRKSGSGFGKVLLLVVAVVALIVLANSLVVTAENKYTLVKQFGKIERIIDKAGLSFKVPFIQSTDTLPKQILIYDLAASEVITMDKKTMVADSYVLWRIDDPQLFVQTLNSQVANAESRINATVFMSMKNIISSLEPFHITNWVQLLESILLFYTIIPLFWHFSYPTLFPFFNILFTFLNLE